MLRFLKLSYLAFLSLSVVLPIACGDSSDDVDQNNIVEDGENEPALADLTCDELNDKYVVDVASYADAVEADATCPEILEREENALITFAELLISACTVSDDTTNDLEAEQAETDCEEA